jgi:hypothetical protein
MGGDLTQGRCGSSGHSLRYARPMENLRRLWQPRKGLFWMMLGFNVMSSVCSWAMRALPLNTFGLLLIGAIALLNVAFGLLAAWKLMRGD